MRLLFIKLKHIGDALLLTPTLAAAKAAHPDATIWVVVRKGSEGILAGCPAIDRVLTTNAPEKGERGPGLRGSLALVRELRRQHFDYAFELTHGDRGRLLAAWSGARVRCANDGVYRVPWFWRAWFNRLSKHDWRNEHQAEAGFRLVNEFLPLGVSEPPPLVFDRARTAPCDLGVKLNDYAVIHPGTRWQRKRWPLEKWIAAGRELLQLTPQLVISVGPDAEEVQLGDALAAALGPRAVTTRGKLSWAQLAGLLHGARLFVGVDTAAMHLAAACQCPTVALFASSVAVHWRPWRVPHRLVGAVLKPGETAADDAMIRIEPAEVLAACRELLDGSGTRLVSTL
ncbi:MAG: glycosyltransferase family 9 protein [Verrucomicrobia bacterium]|nr:glycosyltransferase family 9 protein [Verrucomicrobiota bacterium]